MSLGLRRAGAVVSYARRAWHMPVTSLARGIIAVTVVLIFVAGWDVALITWACLMVVAIVMRIGGKPFSGRR